MPQNQQGVVQALVQIDLLHRRLIQVGVGLKRLDDLGDATGALADLGQQVVGREGTQPAYYTRKLLGRKGFDQRSNFSGS